MNQTKINNTTDDDWGFYIDIENGKSINNYLQRKIPDVIIPDASYCIDIHDFGQETDYRNYYDDTLDYECNLYNTILNILEYYRNKLDSKRVTNMLIKVSSTTFATIALSYMILAIL
jgi:hypothetical protein